MYVNLFLNYLICFEFTRIYSNLFEKIIYYVMILIKLSVQL
jgi:hypothetical protein